MAFLRTNLQDLRYIKVACPSPPCCGMPALDGGRILQAREQARANVERLHPYVARGYQGDLSA